MTSVRVRWAIWSLVAIASLVWTIRSFQVGDAVGGPLTYNWSVEINSWRGTAAIILSEGGWRFRPPWGHWEIPITGSFRKTILKLGVSSFQTGAINSYTLSWPILLPFVLLFLGVEGPAWLRRRKFRAMKNSNEGQGEDVTTAG